MTYRRGLPSSSQPADIHDATWGILSAVYGGAVHPPAEGHAAMADAALPAVASVLQLNVAQSEMTLEPASPIVIAPGVRSQNSAADLRQRPCVLTGALPFFAATSGFIAAACSCRYFAMIAGSIEAIALS